MVVIYYYYLHFNPKMWHSAYYILISAPSKYLFNERIDELRRRSWQGALYYICHLINPELHNRAIHFVKVIWGSHWGKFFSMMKVTTNEQMCQLLSWISHCHLREKSRWHAVSFLCWWIMMISHPLSPPPMVRWQYQNPWKHFL